MNKSNISKLIDIVNVHFEKIRELKMGTTFFTDGMILKEIFTRTREETILDEIRAGSWIHHLKNQYGISL